MKLKKNDTVVIKFRPLSSYFMDGNEQADFDRYVETPILGVVTETSTTSTSIIMLTQHKTVLVELQFSPKDIREVGFIDILTE